MKYLLLTIFLFSFCVSQVPAREYGGKWGDDSIREVSVKYIDETRERFRARALRLSQILDNFPPEVPYPPASEELEKTEERFRNGWLSDKDRERFFRRIMTDFEAARQKLAAAELEAFELWEKQPKEEQYEGGDPDKVLPMVTGEIFGVEMNSALLGVVLDNSPSMKSYLNAVRAEIGISFPSARYMESAGSGLQFDVRSGDGKWEIVNDAWYYAEVPEFGENPFDPKWHQGVINPNTDPYIRQVNLERSPISALMSLVELWQADTIYWFCDFKDDNHEASMGVLEKALMDRDVTLYIHSSDDRPEKEVLELVDKTDGQLIRQRIR